MTEFKTLICQHLQLCQTILLKKSNRKVQCLTNLTSREIIFQMECLTTKPRYCILQKMAKLELLICSNRDCIVIV